MKKRSLRFVYFFIILGLISLPVLGQETPTKRVIIVGSSKKTPTPTPTPTKNAKPTPIPRVTPIPTPTPTVSQIAGTAPEDVKTYVTSRVRSVLANPMLKRGRIGVRIDQLDTGSMLFAQDSDKYLVPASNMKNFSVAAALDQLSPNFRFVTSIYSSVKPEANGSLKGDLIIYGRGDPSLSDSFYEKDLYKGVDLIVDKLIGAGIKRVEGNLIGDETYFNFEPVPFTWEWDDLQWESGAEISPLTINDNVVTLKALPGAIGKPCSVMINPTSPIFRIINNCLTAAKETQRKLRITKKLDENVVEISGVMPEGEMGGEWTLAVTRPAHLFVEMLKQRMRDRGIVVTGGTRVFNRNERLGAKLQTDVLNELARVESVTLGEIVAKTMKPSQNLYTELILRVLGEERGDKLNTEKTSFQKGAEIVEQVMKKAGIEPESVVQYDGSGMSRHNLVTPDSVVQLYKYMDRSSNSGVWRNSLTIGGIDGTLKNRFKGTSAEGNVRGKTGTLDQVSALSGYVTAKSGEKFVFAIITNNISNLRLRTSTIDQIVTMLSDYNSRPEVLPAINSNQR